MAGTGKSTIARTVAHEFYRRKCLGASFFFSRGGGDVGHARKFVTTIALQLASRLQFLKEYISQAVSEHVHIASQGLREQWNQLISQPLSQLQAQQSSGTAEFSFLIVIDALDECEGDNDIRLILQLLSETNSLFESRFRVFLTSRPETSTRLGFRKMPGTIYRDLILHNTPRASVDHDIRIFLEEKFREMREEFEFLTSNWPGSSMIDELVQRADGLFIYAATICRFIHGNGLWLPQDLLNVVIPSNTSSQSRSLRRDVPSTSPTRELDETYAHILERSFDTEQDGPDKNQLVQEFKQIVGSVAILIEPLSAASLAKLLDIRLETINLRVRNLHSVLNIPRSNSHPIRLLHPSFRDFLLDKDRCTNSNFWVDEKQAHQALAGACVQLMSSSLRQDICGQGAPGVLATDIESERVERCIPSELQYACFYWVEHLRKSDTELHENDQVHQFLQTHLLHWLEVLSWTRKISQGIDAILALESIAIVSHSMHTQSHSTETFVDQRISSFVRICT